MNRTLIQVRWLHIAVLLLILLSFLPRVINLSNRPLDNDEAVDALNAAQLSSEPASYWPGEQETITASPLYEWSTGLVFQFTGSDETQARIVPAIAGTMLALLPIFFLGRASKAELLLSSAFLALSPVAVNLSRTAGGAMISALFLTASVLVAALPVPEKSSDRMGMWAAALLGAAIASGTAVYTGMLSLLMAYLLIQWLSPDVIRDGVIGINRRHVARNLWIAPIVAVVLATGAGGFRFGLAGLGESFALWLRGWVPFGQLSTPAFLVAGFAYEPFILIVGSVGAYIAWRTHRQRGKLFSLWALGALLVSLAYSGRTAQDWIWVAVPLAFLAAEAVAALLDRINERVEWLHVTALVSIALVLISAAIVTLIGYVNGYLQQMMVGNDILIGLALLAMLLLLSSVFVLFGLGWSWGIVLDGAGIVIVLATMLMSISAAWNLADDRGLGFRTFWATNSPTENGAYFESTLDNASLALMGTPKAAPVLVQGELEPSITWRLRDHPRYTPADAESAATPPILVTPEGAGLGAYGAEYFGQSFALNLERGWFGLLPPDLLRWSLTHSAPTASTGWVIYIRADIIALTEFTLDAPLE